MRFCPALLSALIVLTTTVGCATRQAVDRHDDVVHEDHLDHDKVLAVLDSWSEGWRTRDAALAVADYAEDADWTNAFGDRFQGRNELREGLDFIFSLDFVMAGDSAGNTFEDVTFLSDEVALIRSQLTRTGQETGTGETMNDRSINHLRVLQKRGGRWFVVSHLISQAKEKGSR